MTRQKYNLLKLYLSLSFFAVPVAAFVAAKYVRFATSYFSNKNADPNSYFLWIIVAVPIWALVVERSKLNEPDTIVTFHSGIRAIGKSVLYMMTVVLAIFFFYRQAAVSRIFAVVGCLFIFILSLGVLHIFRTVLRSKRGPFGSPVRIAILGASGQEMRLANHLESIPLVPVEVVCVISLDSQKRDDSKWPTLNIAHVAEAVDVHRCQEILVSIPPSRLSDLQEVLQPLRDLCVPVRVVLDLGEGVFVPDRIFSFCGVPLLDLRIYPIDTMKYAVGKRILDIILAIGILALASPIIFLIVLAIRLTSSGPVLFSQERISLNGNRFKMLKFRTMHVCSAKQSNSQHTSRNDKRITPVGRLLRRTSLDELPQFLNVLKGDMSVVGPRPELTFFVQKFRTEIPSYMARHNVKCGITGLAQINGCRGSDSSIPERIKYDLHYMQNWSLMLDLNIIFKTLFYGVFSKNAY
jgi:Undecaprenyl-phosphate glucose phosphotransferase